MGTNATTAMTSTQVFAQLDPSRKGYLTKSDVASNSYLSKNFQNCDTNNDGRLSQAEVAVCMPVGH